MKSQLYPSGYIIQSDRPDPFLKDSFEEYSGVARYTLWPLDDVEGDPVAAGFWKEASRTWFNYADSRVSSVPDTDYIVRYLQYCDQLNIRTRVLYLRSLTDYGIDFELNAFASYRMLGYDYAEGDLGYSQLFDDLFDTALDEVSTLLAPYRSALNENGLFPSIPQAQAYIKLRLELAPKFGMEDSTYADILEVTLAKDFDKSFFSS